jgi:membrane associated rhomboid family serine protease
VIVFLLTVSGFKAQPQMSFAVIPNELWAASLFGGATPGPNDTIAIPESWTLVSYMFLHGDVLHIIGNMLFLWVFGDNVEDAMGHFRFLVFYIACGVLAALFHSWMLPESNIGLIGASGAVAGVIAAYLLLHPKVNVWILVLRVIPVKLTAAWVLGAWIAMQFVMVMLPQVGPIAWWAHIGGLIAGAVLIVFMRRPGVPLFDNHPTTT